MSHELARFFFAALAYAQDSTPAACVEREPTRGRIIQNSSATPATGPSQLKSSVSRHRRGYPMSTSTRAVTPREPATELPAGLRACLAARPGARASLQRLARAIGQIPTHPLPARVPWASLMWRIRDREGGARAPGETALPATGDEPPVAVTSVGFHGGGFATQWPMQLFMHALTQVE
jgi:hypothetical protein